MKKSQFATKTLSLLLASACMLTSCSKGKERSKETSTSSQAESTSDSSTEQTSETTTQPDSPTDSIIVDPNDPYYDRTLVPIDDEIAAELKKLPGVVDVARYELHSNDDEYVIFFEMPIDHNDPSQGTFIQRANLKYRGKDRPTVFCCTGYDLSFLFYDEDPYFDMSETIFSEMYECNFLEVEYRFYGTSTPQGFSYDNPEYWQYLTNENASEDFHTIIESVKNFLPEKWVFEGCSKGGCLTVYQAGSHPEDADLFLAEAAMVKCSQNYPGLYEYCYTTAGNERFGEDTAQEYRDMILKFQVECIRYQDEIVPLLEDFIQLQGSVIDSDLTSDILFECMVLDQIYFWQYCDEYELDDLEYIIQYIDNADTEPEIKDLPYRLLDTLIAGYGPWQYQIEDSLNYRLNEPDMLYLYNFQNYREDGNYLYDFSYLRDALEKDGNGLTLTITEKMEPEIHSLRVYKGQREALSYSPDTLNMRMSAIENTEKPLILINGLTDVHAVAEVTESDNPNVYIFNIPDATHIECEPNNLSDTQFEEFEKIVKAALGI